MWQLNWPVESDGGETWRGRCLLLAAMGAAAILWLAILPRIEAQPAVRAYIDRNEQLGVDPAAKFYTELPCMPGLYHRVERSLHRRPDSSVAVPLPQR